MFEQMEVQGAQKAPVTGVQYLIKGHDMNIPFSSSEGYDDKGAIARAQSMSDAPGLVLYKKVGQEAATVLYDPRKPKVKKK